MSEIGYIATPAPPSNTSNMPWSIRIRASLNWLPGQIVEINGVTYTVIASYPKWTELVRKP